VYTWKKLFTPVFFVFLFSLCLHGWFSLSRLYFSQDLARDLFLIEQYKIEKTWLVPYGPKASVGNFYLPPFYYQIFLGLSSLVPSPFTMTLLIVIIESFTPVLLFIIVKRLFDEKAAIVAGILAASAPLVVIFSTFSWNPNMVPFFSLLTLLALLEYGRQNNLKYLVTAFISFSIAFQLHYQATLLVPVFLFAFLQQVFQKKILIKHWLIASIAAIALFVPYGMAEISNNFQNSRALYTYVTEEHAHYFDQLSKNYFVWTFIPAFVERVQLQENTNSFRLGRILIFIGLPLLCWYAYKKKLLIVALYFLGILFMLRVYKGDKVDYYMSTLFIFPSLLLASLFHWKKYLGLPLIIFALVISGFNLGKIERVNQFSEMSEVSDLLLIEIPSKQVRFIIHDDDFANTMVYLSKMSDITIDQSSLQIVDVCKKEEPCFLYPTSFSTKTNMESFTSELRASGKYHYKTTITPETLPFVLHVGYLEQAPERTISHPLLQQNSMNQFGSDMLMSELFE